MLLFLLFFLVQDSLPELGGLREGGSPKSLSFPLLSSSVSGGLEPWVEQLRGEDFLIPWLAASDQSQRCHVIAGVNYSPTCALLLASLAPADSPGG